MIRRRGHAEIAIISILFLSGWGLLFPLTTDQARGSSHFVPHAPIYIQGDSSFTVENGVTRGRGTVNDPYIIAGWEISKFTGPVTAGGIAIVGTEAYFIIRDVYIHSLPTSSGSKFCFC